jgi:hypothetical protein
MVFPQSVSEESVSIVDTGAHNRLRPQVAVLAVAVKPPAARLSHAQVAFRREAMTATGAMAAQA